jgi:superoxide oxidase
MSATVPQRYARGVRLLHWLTVALMIAVYALVELRGYVPRGSRGGLMQWHMWLGLAVLLLVLPRLGARLFSRTPPIQPPPARLLHWAAQATHLALYGFLIVQPLLGLVTAQSGERLIHVPFADTQLPQLVPVSHDLHEWAEDLHEALGRIFYFVIGLHAAAALAHHFVFRDNTLRRML